MAAGEQEEIERSQKSENESFVTVISGLTGKIKLFVNGGNMKPYSTYQEARIENPYNKIYTNGKSFGTNDYFDIGHYGVTECKPKEYCMTVEQFIRDGKKFTSDDIVIDGFGFVAKTENCGWWNEPREFNDVRFILRAAALEKTNPDIHHESEYYKKPRTRVEYVKCDFDSTHDAYYAMLKGVELFSSDGMDRFKFDGKNFIGENGIEEWKLECHSDKEQFYRKIETEIDERQEFIDESFGFFSDGAMVLDAIGRMFDSGKFKYIGGDDADK